MQQSLTAAAAPQLLGTHLMAHCAALGSCSTVVLDLCYQHAEECCIEVPIHWCSLHYILMKFVSMLDSRACHHWLIKLVSVQELTSNTSLNT